MEIKLGLNFKRSFNKNFGSFEWYPSEAKKDAAVQSLGKLNSGSFSDILEVHKDITVQYFEEIQKEPAGSFY